MFKLNQQNIPSLSSNTIQIPLFSSASTEIKDKVIHVIADVKNDTLISNSVAIKGIQSPYFTNTADYLKNIPGFSMIRNGGANNDLIFRGMRGSKVRVLIDDTEIIGVCCDRMDPASSYINLETFDVLNIIKGPQTVLYGPAVSGGILQFQRFQSYPNISQVQLHSNITVGSNNSISKNIDSTLGNKYGYIRLIGNLAHSDDYYDGNRCRVHSAWYKWNADAILSFDLKELDTHIEINLGQGNSRASCATSSMDGLCFAKENYEFKIDSININNLLSKITLKCWHYHLYHLMVNNSFYFNILKKKPFSVPNKQHCCSNNIISDLDRFVWGIRSIATCEWENIQCSSGIDVYINHHKKNKHYNNANLIDISMNEIGIFNECSIDLLSNQKLIGGVRIEYTTTNIYDKYYHDSTIFNQYQIIYPTGFIRYEKNIYPSFSYYIGIGTSQHFPDYWKLISSTFSEDIKKTNHMFQLKPERTIQIDTGVYFKKSKIDSWISTYVGYINNYIYNNDYIQNNIVHNINNVHAQIFGSEIGLSYQFNDYWQGKSNISWIRGMDTDNHCILPDISPVEGILILQFQQKNYYLEISCRLVSLSEYIKKILFIPDHYNDTILYGNNDNTISFGVCSVYAAWKSPKYITYSIGINNLFNQSYIEHFNKFNFNGSEKSKQIPIYEPGRIWWIKATIDL